MNQTTPKGRRVVLLFLSIFLVCSLAACESNAPHASSMESSVPGIGENNSALSLDDYLIYVATEQARKINLRADPYFTRLVNTADHEVMVIAATYRETTPDNLQSIDVFTVNAETNEVLRALLGTDYLEDVPDDLTEEQLADIGEQAALILPQMIANQYGLAQSAASGTLNFSTECLSHKDFAGTRCVVLNYSNDLSIWVIFSENAIANSLRVNVIASRGFENFGEEMEQILNRLTEGRAHYDSWIAPADADDLLQNGAGNTDSPPVEMKIALDEYLASVSTSVAQDLQQKAHPFLQRLAGTPEETMVYATDYNGITPNNPNSVEIFSINTEADNVFRAFMDESDYDDFVDEAPGKLTKEQLAQWNDDITERAPFMIPQWINNLVGVEWFAAASGMTYVAECPSHKDFEGTQCVLLNYGDYQGVWVIFTKSEIADVLNVYAVATRSFEELRSYGDDMWKDTDALLNILSETRRHYD